MGFDKHAVTPRGHGGTGQNGSQFTVATGAVTRSAGTLHRMRRVENYLIIQTLHPVNGTHVGDKVIVPETHPALGEEKRPAPHALQLLADIPHVPRRKELAFFHIDHPATPARGQDQVGLPAEKRRNLQNIDKLRRDLHLRRRVHVRGHRHLQVGANLRQQLAARLHPQTPEGTPGGPVRLVIGRLENKRNPGVPADGMQFFGHPTDKRRRLDHTGPQYKQRHPAAQGVGADFHNRSRHGPQGKRAGRFLAKDSGRRWETFLLSQRPIGLPTPGFTAPSSAEIGSYRAAVAAVSVQAFNRYETNSAENTERPLLLHDPMKLPPSPA